MAEIRDEQSIKKNINRSFDTNLKIYNATKRVCKIDNLDSVSVKIGVVAGGEAFFSMF